MQSHDPTDFEIGLRHDLPQINVMAEDGTMNGNAGRYQGMDRYECRKRVLADLQERSHRLLFIPDLLHCRLSGAMTVEASIASISRSSWIGRWSIVLLLQFSWSIGHRSVADVWAWVAWARTASIEGAFWREPTGS